MNHEPSARRVRPRRGEAPRPSVHLSLRLPKDLLKIVDERAKAERKTRHAVLRALIAGGISQDPRRAREALAESVRALREKLAPRLPDIDPHDLDSILMAIPRPWGSGRRFFLRRQDNHYVF